MQEEIKIPKERIAVLIGEKGSTKRKIQNKTKTKITVSSKDGDVTIDGEDSLNVFTTSKIIKAIGRGFNPEIAIKLLQESYEFDLINLKDFTRDTKGDEERVKARLIGTRGRARRTLERETNTYICIYGKTVAIIGKVEDMYLARRAVERLLQGAPHSNVYQWISKQKLPKNT